MTMVFEWKPGTWISASANDVGNAFSQIVEENGKIDTDLIVERAKSDDVLHDLFEWDDTVAGHLFRKNQASFLLRAITVKVKFSDDEERPPLTTRAFVNLKDSDSQRSYHPISEVIQDEEKRRQMLEQALRELEWFRRKYSILEELTALIGQTIKQFKVPVS